MPRLPPFDLAAFSRELAVHAGALEAVLKSVLAEQGPGEDRGESDSRDRLVAAMSHALLAGGKRFRPYLLNICAALCAGTDGSAGAGDPLLAGAAVECLHTYSLVHDDLPAMDDDDVRRGQPTVHKAFDEATAILAGDALMTLAFEILARPAIHPDPAVRMELISILARASGVGGMAGGQMLDLAGEYKPLDSDGIMRMQQLKTGALIAASCEMGAVISGGGRDDRRRLHEFGAKLGVAFQIADDLLDVEAEAAAIGKATDKDTGKGKATFVALMGADLAHGLVNDMVGECIAVLSPYGEAGGPLIDAARFAGERDR